MADRQRLIGTITTSGTTGAAGQPMPAGRLAQAIIVENGRLTLRDRTLLNLLADHLTFTTEQLAAIAFGSLGHTRNRLNQLHARGILDRFRQLQRPGSQSWRWTLGPVGAAIVAASRGVTIPRPAAVRDAAARLAVSPTLNHRLAVNGWFAGLLAYARTRDGVRLSRWWTEARCREATANLVRPDGHGMWQEAGRVVPFWLEMDLDSEPVARVVAKLTGYANLTGTHHGFPVLFWLPTTARETNLLARMTRTGTPPGVVVATASNDTADPDGPAGAVWRTAGHPARVRLVDLPGSRGAP